jgi:hypothetical protein
MQQGERSRELARRDPAEYFDAGLNLLIAGIAARQRQT